jgi:alkylation response protein AidB-like acyl-CoA dehydrogenase
VTTAGSVLDAVRRTAEERIARQAARIDSERAFPDDNLRALAEIGGLGLVVPVDQGGSGGALSALAEACEAFGSACASTAMVFLMHSVTAATVAAGGGGRSAAALTDMVGGTLGTLSFSERGTGAHFYAPELQAVRSNGGVRISGRKSFVTSGGRAGLYLVLVAGEAEGAADAYLVRGDHPGVTAVGSWAGLGMAGNSSVALELDDVELVPALLELRAARRRAARRRGRHRVEHQHRLRRRGGADRRRRAGARDARRRRRLSHGDRRAARGGRVRPRAARAGQPRLRPRRDPPAALPRARGRRRGRARARALRHRPRQARRHRRLRAARRPRGGRGQGRRRRRRRRDLGRDALRGLRAGGRARGGVAKSDLLPLQLHRAAVVRRESGRAVDRGAAGDELRRSSTAQRHGPRRGQALAAGPRS